VAGQLDTAAYSGRRRAPHVGGVAVVRAGVATFLYPVADGGEVHHQQITGALGRGEVGEGVVWSVEVFEHVDHRDRVEETFEGPTVLDVAGGEGGVGDQCPSQIESGRREFHAVQCVGVAETGEQIPTPTPDVEHPSVRGQASDRSRHQTVTEIVDHRPHAAG